MSGYMNKKHSRYPLIAKNDDNPEGVAKKNEVIVRKLRKKMHFFVWQFGVYLHNSYFLVSKPLSCAFLWE